MLVPFLSLARNPSLLLPSAVRAVRVAMSASPAAATVSVEYAKSGRSTCKGCSATIASGALRLGASARDSRGFDSTKWYHVACFPASSHPLGPVEGITGFDAIKDDDREELRQLEKNCKRGNATVGPLDEPKKVKPVSETASVSVEYAKSGRSTCKGCSENIGKGALRVGASSHDPRGFESTKWYHVACFPASSYPVSRVENLKGFDSIKTEDHEKLLELEGKQMGDGTASDQSNEPNLNKETVDNMGDSKEGAGKSLEEVKNHKRGNAAADSLDEPSPKKVKRISEKASVSVEYAKSGRSTCKGCSENIAKGALRLGASARDPRGFDSTKWYHVACFHTSSYPVSCVENLKGFDSIKTEDREKLRELEEKQAGDCIAADQSSDQNLNKETVDNMGDSEKGAGKSLEDVKSHKRGNAAVDSLDEPSPKKVKQVSEKLSVANKGTGLAFSVSDVKDEYKGATLPAHWKVFTTVIFREKEDGLHSSAKIAAFDFDGCLAKTDVRSIGADKWSLMHKSIPENLQKLYNDGYKLVIFTNESNIERWKNKRQVAVDSKVGRLDQFIERVKVPIQVFIACGLGKGKGTPDDQYRKPNPGMWWLMAQHFNSGVKIDMDQSFYVGDAAGRENDHSDADIKFAKAIGLKFHVPEEYFGC